jgi:hypothetical protein
VESDTTINQKLTLKLPPDAHVAECPAAAAAAASNTRGNDPATKRINKEY